MKDEALVIAGTPLRSRLFVGTAGYPNQQVMLDSLAASGAELVTASIRRISLDGYAESLVDLLGDRETLYPDVEQLVHAADELVRAGFVVLPYCNEDPVACQKLADVGCAAVMPLGSLIGSGRGIANPAAIELICKRSPVPVVLDAGIGTASDAAFAMELGCDAVMANTAIAKSHDPRRMASAMRAGVEGGRLARLAGRIPKRSFAEPSSPQLGLVGS